jgi:hypothetical protein
MTPAHPHPTELENPTMRLAKHLPTLLLATILPLAGACGSDGGDDDGTIDPGGTDHTYVVSKVSVPTSPAEATTYGLDIDDKPNDSNNGIDNQLGGVLANIGQLAMGIDVQGSIDEQVATGGIILLTNLLAKDLASASGVGMWVYLGENPNPPACADANDTVCGKHLAGGASFDISASSPQDATLAGKIVAGKFTGGPGTVTLQIALSAGNPIDLPLQKARAELTGISATGITGGKIGGAIAKTDLETKVYPAIAETVRTTFARDCTVGGDPNGMPKCGCTGSTGPALQSTFDKSPADCMITDNEVVVFISGLISPDIDLDGDGTADAVSLGVGVKAVAGTFTVPAR